MPVMKPTRILYMEDDNALARLFQRVLGRLGYDVQVSGDGSEGLDRFSNERFDVLVLDQNMPSKTGLEVIRALSSESRLPPTIMLTGAGDESLAVEAIKLGASDYLIKDGDCRYLELIPAVIEQALFRERILREKEQAEQALRAAHDDLERRVKERTAELEQANRDLVRENAQRIQTEHALEMRLNQQAMIAEISQIALAGGNLSDLYNDAIQRVSRCLDVEFAAILRLTKDGTELVLNAGVGWKQEVPGRLTLPVWNHCQYGYTLLAPEPVSVQDLRTDGRFDGPDFLLDHGAVSGLSVVIPGRKGPYGVIAVHTARNRLFTQHGEHFLQSVANLLSSAIERKQAEDEINAVCRELDEAHLDTVHKLALAAQYKDEDTGEHIFRIGRQSALIADVMGLPPVTVKDILHAAPMHDVGKIGIPDSILLKPGSLTPEEFEIMRRHTEIGAAILADSKSEILKLARQIALCHHERWDGRGYPRGLAGTDIPIESRIVAVVDVFDVLTSRRPYKEPYPIEVALEIVQLERGGQFDPDVVDIFLLNFEEILKIRSQLIDESDKPSPDFQWSERDLSDGKSLWLQSVRRASPMASAGILLRGRHEIKLET